KFATTFQNYYKNIYYNLSNYKYHNNQLVDNIMVDNKKRLNRWYFGGVSSAAAVCITHPLDLLKVHLQTQQLPRKTIVQTVFEIYKAGGIKGFYRGMSASLLRQLTYSNARFGIYEYGKFYIDTHSVGQTLSLAVLAGTFGGAVGVPFDVVNVRMQNDLKLPKEQRRNYKHAIDGLYRVSNEEGIKSLFRGGSAAILRGVMMTMGQNVCYDKIKNAILKNTELGDNMPTHFLTSFMTGGIATLFTQPLDVMKTRLMNAKPGQYSGLFAVAKDIAKLGPFGFFKGFIPAFARIGPHTILTFLMMEQLRLHFGYIRTENT
ncbi:hypothetical protein DOY81_001634, partial [Sarcophaga bullata]